MTNRSRSRYFLLVLVLDLFVFATFALILTPSPKQFSVATAAITPKRTLPKLVIVQGIPTRIVIASLGIDKPVLRGAFDTTTGEWTLDDVNTFFAEPSVPANNNNGTTLIYGHATDAIFGPLTGLQVGATLDVYTDSGRVFHYTYYSANEVGPDSTDVFSESGPPTLVLQTCVGEWYSNRMLYRFAYQSESTA